MTHYLARNLPLVLYLAGSLFFVAGTVVSLVRARGL
jgi:hypothetical protein